MKQEVNKKLPDGEEYPAMVVMTEEKYRRIIEMERKWAVEDYKKGLIKSD